MTAEHIIVGQKVNPVKKQRARQLRQEMTPEEKILWHYLRNGKCGFNFRRQQVIDGFIIDFYCHETGLILEIDGAVHKLQKEYDAERDRIIQTRGLYVLRITNDEIHNNLYHTISRIKQTCLTLTETPQQ